MSMKIDQPMWQVSYLPLIVWQWLTYELINLLYGNSMSRVIILSPQSTSLSLLEREIFIASF